MNKIIKEEDNDNNKHNNKLKYLGLLLACVLIIIIIGGYFLIKYSLIQTISVKKELESKKITLESKKTNLEDSEKLVENYNRNKAKLEEIANAMPTEKDIPNILVQLENIAKKSNMLFKSIKISEETKNQTDKTHTADVEEIEQRMEISVDEETKNLKNLSLDVEVQGSYDALMSYLNKVESNIRIMDVNSIKITSQTAGAGGVQSVPGIFSYTINMSTYYIK